MSNLITSALHNLKALCNMLIPRSKNYPTKTLWYYDLVCTLDTIICAIGIMLAFGASMSLEACTITRAAAACYVAIGLGCATAAIGLVLWLEESKLDYLHESIINGTISFRELNSFDKDNYTKYLHYH